MNSEMIGYMVLRKLIGMVGFFLPALLVIGNYVAGSRTWEGSISAFYYTPMRNELVIALGGIGFFLSTYKGYERDWIPMRLAAFFAFGVAIFPTVPENPTPFNNLIGIFHGISAGLLFATMTYVALFLFTRSDTWMSKSSKVKRDRNTVYIVCGVVMAASLVGALTLTHIEALQPFHPMFWFESITIMAFGVSWLVKGQVVLKDSR